MRYGTLSVIIATGANWRRLGAAGEERFIGKGVSFCATCDGPFYRNREVAVVGGGDTAIQEALYLTRFAKKVTVIHRRDRLRATAILQKRAFANEKIAFAWNSVVESIEGLDLVQGIKLKDVKTGGHARACGKRGLHLRRPHPEHGPLPGARCRWTRAATSRSMRTCRRRSPGSSPAGTALRSVSGRSSRPAATGRRRPFPPSSTSRN